MALYGFKERFCPMILDGSKTHTIREARKKGHAKPGQKMYLYHGLRTKNCIKLGEAICDQVREIMICEEFILLREANGLSYEQIDDIDADRFAWCDGFRPEGSTIKIPGPAFNLMLRYWKQNLHPSQSLPWTGFIIYWKNLVPDTTTHLTKKINT